MDRLLQESVERDFERAGRTPPEYCEALEKAWDLLSAYRTSENDWLLDSLFQWPGDGRPRRVDIAFLSELVFQLMKGHLYYLGIDVGRVPAEDPAKGILDQITLSAIGAPFSVEFSRINDQRCAVLTWNKPVTVHSHLTEGVHHTKKVGSGRAVLQIGYTRALNTGIALWQSRCLARWPRGHHFVYLFYTDVRGIFDGINDPARWLSDKM
jgi:hypothetical protein